MVSDIVSRPQTRQNCCYMCDAILKAEPKDLLNLIEIKQQNLKGVLPKQKAHRHTGFEILTNRGYGFDFEATDCYTEKRITDTFSAEFSRGLLFFVLLKQLNIGGLTEFYFLP